jgi:hypothetical protein
MKIRNHIKKRRTIYVEELLSIRRALHSIKEQTKRWISLGY